MHEYNKAAKFFAESVAKIGVNVLWLIISLIQTGKAVYKGKEISINTRNKVRAKFIESNCHDHLIYGDGIKTGQGGVSGAHNKSYFQKTITDKYEPIFKKEGLKFNINDCIESTRAHPSITGVEEVKYKLPAMNQNNTVNQGVYKKIKAPKTVYDPSIISDNQMLQWGKEAMQNGIDNGTIVGIKVFGESSNGL